MRPQTILILAYHFPPEPAIGAARPFRFYKYLSRLGYSCKVITAAPQTEPPPVGVIYVPDPFVAASHRNFKWQLERAIRWGSPAVVGMGWSQSAYRVARELFQKESAARVTVISTFPPLGVHMAAWRLAKTEGWSWIADFRDPVDGRDQRCFRRWLERKIIYAADAVIANTDTSRQNWQRQYPARADRIHLLWNGFDPESRIAAKPLPRREYKTLTHTGELYTGRMAGPILASIDRLMEGWMIPRNAVHVRLVGAAEPSALGAGDVLARAQARGWLELSAGPVPPSEARDIMQTSDYLLLIQQQSTTQVPGKLFEYLQIGRPILAFVAPDSPTERILMASGIPHRCLYPQDTPPRMDHVIAEFLNLPTEITPANAWFEENFNGQAQTRALADIINKT